MVDENIFANLGLGQGTGLLALSTSVINPHTGSEVVRPESPEYSDLSCNHSDWVFYTGAPTGDASDALSSLGVTKEFPTATTDWGDITSVVVSDTGGDSGEGAGVFFYHNLPTPVNMGGDMTLVLLGSTVRGAGDIVIYPEYSKLVFNLHANSITDAETNMGRKENFAASTFTNYTEAEQAMLRAKFLDASTFANDTDAETGIVREAHFSPSTFTNYTDKDIQLD